MVQALIDNLIERGLDPAPPRLFIIDGAKALRKAQLNQYEIDIDVRSGVVTMVGTIAKPEQRKAAEKAVSSVHGVTKVIPVARVEEARTRKQDDPSLVLAGERGGLPIEGFDLGNSPAEFARKLLHEAHVASVPGEGFGTQEHIRLSYATSQKELDRGLERLRNFVSSF